MSQAQEVIDNSPAQAPAEISGLIVGSRFELKSVFLGGILVAGAWISTLFDAPEWVMWVACLLSAPLTSARTSQRALAGLRSFTVDIDVLMFVAAIGAAIINKPIEGAFLLFLFGVGAVSEHLALNRAENALTSLEKLAPDTAERISADGEVEVVNLTEVIPGDLIRVRPFERIPCDGTVSEGSTAIDESTLTGESIPIEKSPGSPVLAGTLNTGNAITIVVEHPASESALARVIQVVTEARTRRAHVEMLTERIEKWYAPSILLASALVFAIPSIIWGNPATWFYRSMAFLTAGSPCALAIGAPATYLCGIAAGARRGIVFKGGQSMEALSAVNVIAFDKTGTITTGKPHVAKVIAFEREEAEILALAAAVESLASHPLADAIVEEARARGIELPEVANVNQLAGVGASGVVRGSSVRVASPSIIDNQSGSSQATQVVRELSSSGNTVVVVEQEGTIIGLIGLRDSLREDAPEAVKRLADRGIRMVMLTGDHEEAAQAIAQEVGLNEVRSGQSPEDKMAFIEDLIEENQHVAMIGDGVNDAPALARASVSLSMGGAASDVAAENADVVIMGERLTAIPLAIAIAQKGSAIMKQNLLIALAVILIVAPLAVAGVADLAFAVLFHEGSTVVVVLNALRQLRKFDY